MGWVFRIQKPIAPLAFVDNKIRFILCTDIHFGNNDTDSTVISMDKAVNDCNEWRPNALISTGDIAATRRDQAGRWFNHVWRCQRPVYVAIGNHDESEYAPGSYGNPADISGETLMDRAAPYYYSVILSSGDGSLSVLCLFLDVNFYANDPDASPPGNSPNHTPGDRIGLSDIEPAGGYYHQLGETQIAWVASTLAQNPSCQFVLVFNHYEPIPANRLVDYALLADVLYADGRPVAGFCGHNHSAARTTNLNTTDGLHSIPFYEMVAMEECGAWARVTLSYLNNAINVDGAVIFNFTDPGGWTINSPFTLAA